MFVITAMLAVLLAAVFFAAGGSKVAALAQTSDAANHVGLSLANFRLVGAAEILGALG